MTPETIDLKPKQTGKYSDLGHAGLHQQMRGRMVEGGKDKGTRIAIVQIQVPLDYYHFRKKPMIDLNQYEAGKKLHRDFHLSGQTPGIASTLDGIGGRGDFTQAQMEALERWRAAMKEISGKIGQLMVLNVCCYGYLLKEISYLHYRNSQQAMPRFKEALDDLVKHYGINYLP